MKLPFSSLNLFLLLFFHDYSYFVNSFVSNDPNVLTKKRFTFVQKRFINSFPSSPKYSALSLFPTNRLSFLPSVLFPPLNIYDIWYQYALVSSAAVASLQLEKSTSIGRALSAPVCSMLLTVILTNFQFLPPEGSIHLRTLVDFAVKLATPMLLLNADLKRTYREAGASLLLAFFLGTMGTIFGAVIAYTMFGSNMANGLSVPGDGWKLASALAAKNIGGGLNYMGVASALQLSPTALATGLTVDNLLGLLYFPFISFIGSFASHSATLPSEVAGHSESVAISTSSSSSLSSSSSSLDSQTNDTFEKPQVIAATNTLAIEPFISALSLSLVIVAISEYLSKVLPVPAITISTVLSVVLATIFPSPLSPLLPASDLLGKLLLTLFFAAIGNLSGTIYNALFAPAVAPLIGFNTVLYAIHLAFIFGIGKLFKLKIEDLAIASNANIGNAATASALAVSKGWTRLIVPALLVGCLGNAIGTLLGVSLGTHLFSKMF